MRCILQYRCVMQCTLHQCPTHEWALKMGDHHSHEYCTAMQVRVSTCANVQMQTPKWAAWPLTYARLIQQWGLVKKTSLYTYKESPHMHRGNPQMNTGVGSKKFAYGESPFANGHCMHMVIIIHILCPDPITHEFLMSLCTFFRCRAFFADVFDYKVISNQSLLYRACIVLKKPGTFLCGYPWAFIISSWRFLANYPDFGKPYFAAFGHNVNVAAFCGFLLELIIFFLPWKCYLSSHANEFGSVQWCPSKPGLSSKALLSCE